LSSIFFLANRKSKATIGLAELDKKVSESKESGEAVIEKKKHITEQYKAQEYVLATINLLIHNF
jgi:hypothetical protein